MNAHINFLGWATLALTEPIQVVAPTVAESALARWHFWLHNLGLPMMMGGLAAAMLGLPSGEPFIMIGAMTTAAGLFLFVLNLFAGCSTPGMSERDHPCDGCRNLPAALAGGGGIGDPKTRMWPTPGQPS